MRQERARRSKPLLQKIEKAEKEMAALQSQQAAAEAFLSQESAYLPENKAKLQQTLADVAEIKVKLSEREESWLQWQQDLETLEAALAAEFDNF